MRPRVHDWEMYYARVAAHIAAARVGEPAPSRGEIWFEVTKDTNHLPTEPGLWQRIRTERPALLAEYTALVRAARTQVEDAITHAAAHGYKAVRSPEIKALMQRYGWADNFLHRFLRKHALLSAEASFPRWNWVKVEAFIRQHAKQWTPTWPKGLGDISGAVPPEYRIKGAGPMSYDTLRSHMLRKSPALHKLISNQLTRAKRAARNKK